MHETTVELSYRSSDRAATIEAALRPEVGAIAGDRTAVSLDRNGTELQLTVRASDPVALRAGQNTWLGLLEVAEDVGTIR
ncbi:KEOPS complex subunit Pcc1 [Halodesulfurarchaeum sp. HSR-GB]|uniref:KEOPS complex subunit Pcc1 n=1 Tax=Halodesulfurarchaeum sp. HSR-GB TaxID=3074077 RepID=UPI0028612FBA|nr:KEOPS complex subunit Pcc1 [Halodesulfurarchaeum sp. HSR-GB]MDR5656736.1 KEOPS complex subunit Pcc1 [Halodesulfurarchaeum sp. HSR-GB]